MSTPPSVPEEIAAALAPGVVHPGQWVMTRRDTQLTWLIRFSRAWKDLSPDRQRATIADPWALKAFAATIQAPAADSARLALLYLSHPDTFEAIVSPDHKGLIVDRFSDVAGDEDDIDRRLLAARGSTHTAVRREVRMVRRPSGPSLVEEPQSLEGIPPLA